MRICWLTNDLPPRAGGIEQFVHNLLVRTHPDSTVVVGPSHPGAVAHDRSLPYRVVRAPGSILPTPTTLDLLRVVARDHRPDVIVLGASWPLGELAAGVRREPGVPVIALSHGLEAGLAQVGLGRLIRRATRDLAALTTISDYCERQLRPHVAAARTVRIPPGVDIHLFRPGLDGQAMRATWGVPTDAALVGCISRLVPRKGQDALLDVWPQLASRHPDAWLVLAGSGPLEARLRGRAAGLPRVVVPGAVPWADLPSAFAALDIFAMPCRTRLGGTDVEGLGIVYLEAQACGVPVVSGRSGGAPEAVQDGISGHVVDGRDHDALVAALDGLLADPQAARRMGAAGRAVVEQQWSWERIAGDFRALLGQVARG